MKSFKDNQYYMACWERFFPNTQPPKTDELFIKSIINAGRHLLRRCKVENYSYVPISVASRETQLKEYRVALYNFKQYTELLREELYYVEAQRKYLNQLQYLIHHFEKGIEYVEKTSASEIRLTRHLRLHVFDNGGQLVTNIEKYTLPTFPTLNFN